MKILLVGATAALPLFGHPLTAQEVDARLTRAVEWYTGVAGHVDDEMARALLTRAAADGDVLARMWVARCHSRGRMGFAEDPARAREIAAELVGDVRRLADAGVVEAVFLMGTVHDEALGAAEDPAEAARWYRRAAEAGHVLAQHNLGNAYRAGRGVPASDAEAVRWWTPAAEAGDAIALLRLGEMYEGGHGVTADRAAALRWYEASAARGNRQARAALARLGG